MHQYFLALSLTCTLACAVSAQAIAAEDPTRLLMDLPPLADNQEILILSLESAPGATSQPHRHNAHTYVYLVEGSMIMQVDGEEPVTLQPGDTFYENPANIHMRSENPSQTETAKFLVFMIKTKGEPTSVIVSP